MLDSYSGLYIKRRSRLVGVKIIECNPVAPFEKMLGYGFSWFTLSLPPSFDTTLTVNSYVTPNSINPRSLKAL